MLKMSLRRFTASFRSSAVCRDEIAMSITDTQSKEVDAHKDDRSTERRRKEDSHATWHSAMHASLA